VSRTYNELSAVVITVEPLDPSGAAFTPTTARYRLDDCRTEKQLIPWTDLVVAESMLIDIPGSVNEIQDDTLNKPEEKLLTVNTDNGLETQQYEQYLYRVRNLGFAQVT